MLQVHPCDRRRTITEQSACFPAVDFSLIESNEDVYWLPDVREANEDLQARGRKFADWLLARSEQSIAVVSHSGFLYNLMQNYGSTCTPKLAQHLHRHFRNCEMRTIVLMDQQPDNLSHDPVSFAGGELDANMQPDAVHMCPE